MTSKQQLLDKLQRERERLLQALEGLSDDEMCLPNVIGAWSIKDVLGHIADWERHFTEQIEHIRDGQPLEWVDDNEIEAWNAAHATAKRAAPLKRTKQEFFQVRERLLEILRGLPQEVLERKVQAAGEEMDIPWYVAATWEHDQEHYPDILTWQRELETTEI